MRTPVPAIATRHRFEFQTQAFSIGRELASGDNRGLLEIEDNARGLRIKLSLPHRFHNTRSPAPAPRLTTPDIDCNPVRTGERERGSPFHETIKGHKYFGTAGVYLLDASRIRWMRGKD